MSVCVCVCTVSGGKSGGNSHSVHSTAQLSVTHLHVCSQSDSSSLVVRLTTRLVWYWLCTVNLTNREYS